MARITSYRITGKFTVACAGCGGNTTPKYARQHNGCCKSCVEPASVRPSRNASREEQHARYIDCGPAAWDDR